MSYIFIKVVPMNKNKKIIVEVPKSTLDKSFKMTVNNYFTEEPAKAFENAVKNIQEDYKKRKK